MTPGIDYLDLIGYPADITPDGRTVLIQTLDTGDVFFYDTVTKTLDHKTQIGDPGTDSALGISSDLRVAASVGTMPVAAGMWSETADWLDIGVNTFPTGCDAFRSDGLDITADGKTVVGMAWNACSPQAFRWTDTGGQGTLQLLDILGTPLSAGKKPSNRATKVADDGSLIGGFAMNYPNDRVPAIWHQDGTGALLDPANTGMGEVLAISADGKIAGGYLGLDAFTWTESGGIVTIDRPQGVDPMYGGLANSVVANGKLVFGRYGSPPHDTPVGFVWTPDAKGRLLDDVINHAGITLSPDYAIWNITAASTDGSVVVGIAYGPNSAYAPFILKMPVTAYAPF
jgi:hypothetical protein